MSASPSPWTEILPRREAITVEEFQPLVAAEATPLLQLGNGVLQRPPDQWRQRQIYLLSRLSNDFETWLDDFGARENREYHVFRELTALIRWLATAMASLAHLDARLSQYELPDAEWSEQELAPRVRTAALRLGGMIRECFRAYRESWGELGLDWPSGLLTEEEVGEPELLRQLPRDLIEASEAGESPQDGPAAARLASRFLGTCEALASVGQAPESGLEELRRYFTNRQVSEEKIRILEARVHNLQSYYDSHVAGAPEEREHPELRALRGAVSQALHLLEAATALVHLYERHDVYERRGASRELFERLIHEENLLGMILNSFGKMAYECFQRGSTVAAKLVSSLIQQVTADLSLPPDLTLHARPVSLIASIVNQHGTPVEAEIAGQSCNAASIMQLLVLVGSHPGATAIRFRGEETVLDHLASLFEHRLGEDGLDRLPSKLHYLRP